MVHIHGYENAENTNIAVVGGWNCLIKDEHLGVTNGSPPENAQWLFTPAEEN